MSDKRILIIEDEYDLAHALDEYLSDKGYEIEAVPSAEVGLSSVRKRVPDLILLDLILPGMSGLKFLEAIKGLREKETIPVIILSNIDNPDDLKKAREYNIEEYLIKTDWRLEDVVKKIEEALQ